MISAQLIGLTQPLVSVPVSTPEALVAYCARVSSNKQDEEKGEDYEGLLNYCIRNKHWSIFEMVNALVEVWAPRDISRQLLRHSSLHFQEFSQRYSDQIQFCDRDIRKQDHKNRQNSIDVEDWDGFDLSWEMHVESVKSAVQETYKRAIQHDVAKECARVVLPEGLTMSHLFVNGTLRDWYHYLDVRDDPGVTQWEHVVLAREIRKALAPAFPTIIKETKNG